jgi:hypothetical protein
MKIKIDRRKMKRLIVGSELGDIHPVHGPVIKTKIAIFDDCDKNFCFYWTIPRVLPVVKNVYFFSHPCEPDVFASLNRMGAKVYLDDAYKGYARRWAPSMLEKGKITLMQEDEIKAFKDHLNSLDCHN